MYVLNLCGIIELTLFKLFEVLLHSILTRECFGQNLCLPPPMGTLSVQREISLQESGMLEH